MVESFDARA
jgi:hypothetical protein